MISAPNKEQFKRTHESFHPGGSFLNPGVQVFSQLSDRCQVLENTLRVEQALSAQLKVQLHLRVDFLEPFCLLVECLQGSRGSFGFVWFQKSKKEPQSGSCGVGSSAVRFLAVQETVRFYECDSCAT